MTEVGSYRDLKVWQVGIELTREVYVLTRSFPKCEMYGLASQMRRAAVSIPANIAEGHAKDSTKDFLRHLSIAQGSLAEMETHLVLAESLEYCDPTHISQLLDKCSEEGRNAQWSSKTAQSEDCPMTPPAKDMLTPVP